MSDNINNKQNWNRFILANNGSFLQSYEWGELQEKVGRKVKRFVGDNWAAQFIEYKIPCVNKFYWYCPKGPVIANGEERMANSQITPPQPSPLKGEGAGGVVGLPPSFIETISEAAKKEGVMFWRVGPEWPMVNSQELMANDFRRLPYDIEPSQTQILDITKSEGELLAQMHEKWRYNIRLAERKGVRVKFVNAQDSDFEKYFEEFYRLVSEGTAERKGIKHHPKDYYREQLEIGRSYSSSEAVGEVEKFSTSLDSELDSRSSNNNLRTYLFVAEYEGKVIAANIVVVFGKRATYLHGATCGDCREVMAPHLLQWEQIKYAKAQGCAEYDFWGVVNEHTLDKRGASWEGFTRFKRGFGGREVNYVGYFDYPLNRLWYFLYRLVQKFRR